jgi:AraC-like DNA-binding protein
MYRELPVPPSLAGVVEAVWVREASAADAGAHLIMPDGCTDLMWANGRLVVAGPDTVAQLAEIPPGSSYAAVRFAPGAGPAVIGVPADELRNRRFPLDALWPTGSAGRLTDQITVAPDRIAALLAAVERRLADVEPPDPVAAAVASHLTGGLSVAAVAAAVGYSERQLHRRCLAAFGYGPKTLARILRFQHAVALARSGTGFAEVATRSGYADQAHLARDVRALAGVPLRELTG